MLATHDLPMMSYVVECVLVLWSFGVYVRAYGQEEVAPRRAAGRRSEGLRATRLPLKSRGSTAVTQRCVGLLNLTAVIAVSPVDRSAVADMMLLLE